MAEFSTAHRIILGAGASAELAQLVAEIGQSAFLVVLLWQGIHNFHGSWFVFLWDQ